MQQILEQEERQVEGEGRRKEDQEEKGWSRLWCHTYCSLILKWIKYYMVLLMLITVMMKFVDLILGLLISIMICSDLSLGVIYSMKRQDTNDRKDLFKLMLLYVYMYVM